MEPTHIYILSRRIFLILSVVFLPVLFSGCKSMNPDTTDPDAAIDPLLFQFASANQNFNDRQLMELNRDTVRAYNLQANRFEYVPKDTLQRWNPEKMRWEFTPRPIPDSKSESEQ